MKPAYSSFELATGAHLAGFCRVQIAPKEWLTSEININFLTGNVTGPLSLETGKSWLTLELTEDSYQFSETPKPSKFGDYYEISITGLFNNINPTLRRQLETIRHHELVAIATDRNKSVRVIGTKEKGMKIFFSLLSENANGGKNETAVELKIDMEHTAPYLFI